MKAIFSYDQYMNAPLVAISYRGSEIDEWPNQTELEDRFMTKDMIESADIFSHISIDDMGVIRAIIKDNISSEMQEYFYKKYSVYKKKYKSEIPSMIMDRIETAFLDQCSHFMRFSSSDIASATCQFDDLKGINIRITVEKV